VLFQDPEAFLAEVEQIAAIGAKQLMAHWRALEPDQINEKARNDLVSAADLASEKAIMGAIRSRFPDHSILSEEAGRSTPTDSGPTWIIDPLDGTTNFVHGIPQFAISIGVAVEGRIEFGVILDPCKDDLFSAVRGRGARWNGAVCRVSERQGLPGALVATGFPFKAHRLLDPYLAIFRDVFLRCKAIRRPGAAALLGAGRGGRGRHHGNGRRVGLSRVRQCGLRYAGSSSRASRGGFGPPGELAEKPRLTCAPSRSIF